MTKKQIPKMEVESNKDHHCPLFAATLTEISAQTNDVCSQPLSQQVYQFQSLKIIYNKIGKMLRRNLQIPFTQLQNTLDTKALDCSVSTEGSCSPRECPSSINAKSSIRKDKEKSQLCKKYLEHGFCPYEKKCKFAHGSHELRKNQQPNSKYKTKECGTYLQTGQCMYGARCNFIHKHAEPKGQRGEGDSVWQQGKAEGRFQSRLLTLLNLL